MITVKTELRIADRNRDNFPDFAHSKIAVMELDAQSALYLATILANVQGESDESRAFCTLLARRLFESGSVCR